MTHNKDGKAGHRRLRSGKRKGHLRNSRFPETGSLNLTKMIDDFFAAETVGNVNNQKQKMTNYKAILHQLWKQAVPQKKLRAHKVLLKYIKHGASRGGQEVEIQFAPKPTSTSDEEI